MVACYTCGTAKHWKGMHAGHFIPGRTGSLLLNPMLIRPQCPQCNIFLHGNGQAFALRMVDECGRAIVNDLMALKHQTRKWTRAELEDFIQAYKAKVSSL